MLFKESLPFVVQTKQSTSIYFMDKLQCLHGEMNHTALNFEVLLKKKGARVCTGHGHVIGCSPVF